ncbi:MAG: hypothetical protein KGS72_21555 [Cyanobacteria bacterium REEB67]|nr:hypothetical protein [Cyanobacteria bacterium REEB67]
MNKHPMLSVKEAAHLLGCDERWVRERLNQGQLKGEKKNIGLKEKWFVYAGEVQAVLERKGSLPSMASSEYLASNNQSPAAGQVLGASASPGPVVIDAAWDEEEDKATATTQTNEERLAWLETQRQAVVELAEEMMRPILSQLEEKNNQLKQKEDALQAATYQLGYAKGRLEEQDEKIKLLPDYQARADKAAELEREAETAKERAALLEQNLAQSEQRARDEIARLTEEKELQAQQTKAQLDALTSRIGELERSWWQKFFGLKKVD